MTDPLRRPDVRLPIRWPVRWRGFGGGDANPRRASAAGAPWPPIPASRRHILGLLLNALLIPQTAREAVPRVAASDAGACITDQSPPGRGIAPGPELLASPAGLAAFAASGLRGEGQIIAVYERKQLDLGHCWFKDANHPQAGPDHRKVVASFAPAPAAETAVPPSFRAHALFVAGILAGKNAADDNTGGQGVASDARLVYCDRDVFDSGTDGVPFLDYLVAAANHGARVFNTSWQVGNNGTYLDDACDVDRFTWTHEDCLIVGASGNVEDSLGSPSVAKNGLCVSAAYVGQGDDAGKSWLGDGALFRDANDPVGGTSDGRRKPDLLAYGCGIMSAALGGDRCCTALDAGVAATPALPFPPGVPDGVFCASSFATPVAAAAAAIVRQYFIQGWYPAGRKGSGPARNPSAALLKAVLLNATVATVSALDYPDPILDEGWGLLQIDRALYLEGGRRRLWIEDVWNAEGLRGGECRVYDITVERNDEPLKVTLAWTEPPTLPCDFDDPVVNDLDLDVTAPSGAVYLGNCFFGGESLPTGDERSRDTRNNVEMALIALPDPGRWTIAVRARTVNPVDGKGQGFALAVTGAIDVAGVVARPCPNR